MYILKNTSPQHQRNNCQSFGRKMLKENEKKEEILIKKIVKRGKINGTIEVKIINNAKGTKPKQR
jgi:hypothetical protein